MVGFVVGKVFLLLLFGSILITVDSYSKMVNRKVGEEVYRLNWRINRIWKKFSTFE